MMYLIFLFSIIFITQDFEKLNFKNSDDLILKNLKYRNVGPVRGGRVTTVH